MKRVLLVTLLIIAMLSLVGFTSVEATYWEDAKEMYEWDAVEQRSEMEINLTTPDESYEYKVNMNGTSDLKNLNSYLEIKVEDLKGLQSIPVIKMYVDDLDIYINTEAVNALLSVMGLEDEVIIEEEYVAIESSQEGIDFSPNMLQEMIGFIDNMDLGIEINMVKEGNTYTLTLESDEMIDLLDAYIAYTIENIDDLPNSMPEDIVITEAEKQEVLEGYKTFVGEFKDIAKAFISGSKYYQESTFKEDELKEKVKLNIKTPMGELDMNSESISTKLESYDIKLPKSVFRITDEELADLMMEQMMGEILDRELMALVELDGTYVSFKEDDFQEGQIPLKIEDGKAYITSAEIYELLDIELENLDGHLHIRELNNYGFDVQWDDEFRTIEIYRSNIE